MTKNLAAQSGIFDPHIFVGSTRCLISTMLTILSFAAPSSGMSYQRPGHTDRISVGPDGAQPDAGSYSSVSADGRYVAFYTAASNLVPGDTNQAWDVFVHDRATGVTERMSVATGGAEVFGISLSPSISADGRYVAFHSGAPNLVPDDPIEGSYDVFEHDRITGTTEWISRSGWAVCPQMLTPIIHQLAPTGVTLRFTASPRTLSPAVIPTGSQPRT